MLKVKVSEEPFAIEELCNLSRPEATILLREIERKLLEMYDRGLAERAKCSCSSTPIAAIGCCVEPRRPDTDNYHITANLFRESDNTFNNVKTSDK